MTTRELVMALSLLAFVVHVFITAPLGCVGEPEPMMQRLIGQTLISIALVAALGTVLVHTSALIRHFRDRWISP